MTKEVNRNDNMMERNHEKSSETSIRALAKKLGVDFSSDSDESIGIPIPNKPPELPKMRRSLYNRVKKFCEEEEEKANLNADAENINIEHTENNLTENNLTHNKTLTRSRRMFDKEQAFCASTPFHPVKEAPWAVSPILNTRSTSIRTSPRKSATVENNQNNKSFQKKLFIEDTKKIDSEENISQKILPFENNNHENTDTRTKLVDSKKHFKIPILELRRKKTGKSLKSKKLIKTKVQKLVLKESSTNTSPPIETCIDVIPKEKTILGTTINSRPKYSKTFRILHQEGDIITLEGLTQNEVETTNTQEVNIKSDIVDGRISGVNLIKPKVPLVSLDSSSVDGYIKKKIQNDKGKKLKCIEVQTDSVDLDVKNSLNECKNSKFQDAEDVIIDNHNDFSGIHSGTNINPNKSTHIGNHISKSLQSKSPEKKRQSKVQTEGIKNKIDSINKGNNIIIEGTEKINPSVSLSTDSGLNDNLPDSKNVIDSVNIVNDNTNKSLRKLTRNATLSTDSDDHLPGSKNEIDSVNKVNDNTNKSSRKLTRNATLSTDSDNHLPGSKNEIDSVNKVNDNTNKSARKLTRNATLSTDSDDHLPGSKNEIDSVNIVNDNTDKSARKLTRNATLYTDSDDHLPGSKNEIDSVNKVNDNTNKSARKLTRNATLSTDSDDHLPGSKNEIDSVNIVNDNTDKSARKLTRNATLYTDSDDHLPGSKNEIDSVNKVNDNTNKSSRKLTRNATLSTDSDDHLPGSKNEIDSVNKVNDNTNKSARKLTRNATLSTDSDDHLPGSKNEIDSINIVNDNTNKSARKLTRNATLSTDSDDHLPGPVKIIQDIIIRRPDSKFETLKDITRNENSRIGTPKVKNEQKPKRRGRPPRKAVQKSPSPKISKMRTRRTDAATTSFVNGRMPKIKRNTFKPEDARKSTMNSVNISYVKKKHISKKAQNLIDYFCGFATESSGTGAGIGKKTKPSRNNKEKIPKKKLRKEKEELKNESLNDAKDKNQENVTKKKTKKQTNRKGRQSSSAGIEQFPYDDILNNIHEDVPSPPSPKKSKTSQKDKKPLTGIEPLPVEENSLPEGAPKSLTGFEPLAVEDVEEFLNSIREEPLLSSKPQKSKNIQNEKPLPVKKMENTKPNSPAEKIPVRQLRKRTTKIDYKYKTERKKKKEYNHVEKENNLEEERYEDPLPHLKELCMLEKDDTSGYESAKNQIEETDILEEMNNFFEDICEGVSVRNISTQNEYGIFRIDIDKCKPLCRAIIHMVLKVQKGTVEVAIEDEIVKLSKGKRVKVYKGMKYELRNIGKEIAEIYFCEGTDMSPITY